MKEVMEGLLPRLLAGRPVELKVIDHTSKQALLTNLPMRMKGYANGFQRDTMRVLTLVDRDDDDCIVLKNRLEAAARSAGLPTKTKPDSESRFKVVNRIVVEELEAWFLGDVSALTRAFPRVPPTFQGRARFRDPDSVSGGTWEALLHLLNRAGYYVGSNHLPKIDVARRIAPFMDATSNRSRSFQVFLTGLYGLLAT